MIGRTQKSTLIGGEISEKKEEKVQKEFKKIKDWNDWLRIWNKNDVKEIAIGLLHIGPEIGIGRIPYFGPRRIDFEKIRFYLEVAWMDSSRNAPSQRAVGKKAYQVLVHKLLSGLENISSTWYVASESELEVFKELLKFFAYSSRNFLQDLEPYRSKAVEFVKLFCNGIGNVRISPKIELSPRYEKAFPGWKLANDVARALVNVGAYSYIRLYVVVETIPLLEERIAHQLFKVEEGWEEVFPGGKKEWIAALERCDEKALKLAYTLNKEAGRTLVELLIKRVSIETC